MAAKYYIKYFDANSDGKVDLNEFQRVIQRDMATIAASKSSTDMQAASKGKKQQKGGVEGRKREPGFAWILDFNNDGIISVQEMDAADQVLEGEPAILPHFAKEEL